MPLAIDTVLFDLHNAATTAAALTAATAASGDSATIRNFPTSAQARLEALYLMAGTAGRIVQVKSPMFHDNVRGIEFTTLESPASFLMPREVGQPLYPGDTLVVSMDAAASSDSVCALQNYYSDLPGAAARLHSWGDISGLIKSIKPLEVDITTSATIGAWQDTVITTTEDLLHAGTDYAVLGFVTNAALLCMGIKGQETGNLRVCAPGATAALDISEYFVQMSFWHNTPHIPVFNADNKGSVYVSAAANTASVGAHVQMILAELSQTLGS